MLFPAIATLTQGRKLAFGARVKYGVRETIRLYRARWDIRNSRVGGDGIPIRVRHCHAMDLQPEGSGAHRETLVQLVWSRPIPIIDEGKEPHAVVLARMGGTNGGKARAAKLSPRQREAVVRKLGL
jgi:hypothetical protein